MCEGLNSAFEGVELVSLSQNNVDESLRDVRERSSSMTTTLSLSGVSYWEGGSGVESAMSTAGAL